MTLISLYLQEEIIQHLIRLKLLTEEDAGVMIDRAKKKADKTQKMIDTRSTHIKSVKDYKEFIQKREEEEKNKIGEIYSEIYKTL